MSKIKQAIETAVAQINIASRNTYGAKIYTFEQVTLILEDLLETASEDGADISNGIGVLTPDMIGDLVEKIEERIDGNIHKMDDTDIVDEDSIEISLSGGRYTVDNIDTNKDNIVTEASYGIDDTITHWAERNGIYNEN